MSTCGYGRPILFIHSSNELYGSDRMLLQVLSTLPPHLNHRAVVWIPDDVRGTGLTDTLTTLGISWRILRLPVLRRNYFSFGGLCGRVSNAFFAWLALIRLDPAIVYCTTSASLGSAPIARAAGVRHVLVHIQEVWSGPEAKVLAVLSRFSSLRICISKSVQDAMPRHLLSRSKVVLNAVPDTEAAPRSAAENTGPLKFLMASRWSPTKGYETLLRAWMDGPPPGELYILGAMPPNGSGINVCDLLKVLGSPDTVHILGEVDDIDHYLVAADFLIFPSDTPEGFGLLAVEAFRNARAVIASRSGGLREIIEDGETGRMFLPGNSQELRAILTSCTRAEAARLGESARKTYEAHYSSDRYAADFQALWGAMEPFDKCSEQGAIALKGHSILGSRNDIDS